MSVNTYNCSQGELYTVVDLGWTSCEQNVDAFAAFKGKYTLPFIEDRRAELRAARLLPDEQARNEQAESARIRLLAEADTCLSHWRKLRLYIGDAYSSDLQKTKLDAAGQAYYAKAVQYKWESIKSLLNSGNNFITNNTADLVANQNMPETFAVTFNNATTAFEAQYKKFTDSTQQATRQTREKIDANNDIFGKLMKMFFDGQELFRENEPLRKQFVFDQVLSLASGPKTAGVKGYITNQADGQPLANATISLSGTSKNTLTDAAGRYEILQVAAGVYTIKIEKTGFMVATIENHEVKLSTTGKLDVTLAPAA